MEEKWIVSLEAADSWVVNNCSRYCTEASAFQDLLQYVVVAIDLVILFPQGGNEIGRVHV